MAARPVWAQLAGWVRLGRASCAAGWVQSVGRVRQGVGEDQLRLRRALGRDQTGPVRPEACGRAGGVAGSGRWLSTPVIKDLPGT